jgi:ferrous iron transport protein B
MLREARPAAPFQIDYGESIELEIANLQERIRDAPALCDIFNSRWLAVELLEGEQDMIERLSRMDGGPQVLEEAGRAVGRLKHEAPMGIDIAMADHRYRFIRQVLQESLQCPERVSPRPTEHIDRALTNPVIGIPVFLLIMYLVFSLVVNVSTPYLDWIDSVISGPVTRWGGMLLTGLHTPQWLAGLVLEGVIPGVGGVVVFLPGLIVLFLFIALLEDSGYLARAAVVMDHFLGFAGLRGKSFVPLILGFGCAVPAIYATRTLEYRRERILTGLLVPFMSCAARLPVYVVFGLAFFGTQANLVIWGLYVLGILVAGIAGWTFSRTIFKGVSRETGFVMEMPAFRRPTLRSLRFHIGHRVTEFLRNAGTMILLASIIIWALLSLPTSATNLEESYFGRISGGLAPIFEPAGFGTWETTGALVTGLVAKEVVISTMSQIYLGDQGSVDVAPAISMTEEVKAILVGFWDASVQAGRALLDVLTPGITLFQAGSGRAENPALSESLREAYTPASALAVMVFVLLYIPCVATLGALRDEFGGRWAFFAAAFQLAIAWLLAVVVFQIGSRVIGL